MKCKLMSYIYLYLYINIIRVIQKSVRCRWLKKLRHSKIKFLFSGCYQQNITEFCFPTRNSDESNLINIDSEIKVVSDSGYPLDRVTGEPLTPSQVMKLESDEETKVVEDIHEISQEQVTDNFLNEENDYKGPIMVTTSSVSNFNVYKPGFRIVKVFEEYIKHDFFNVDNIPKSVW